MRASWLIGGLLLVAGCATTAPPVAAPPLAEDLTWSAPTPVAPPVPEPPEPKAPTEPAQARSAKEKVYAYEPGETYKVEVPVGAPMDVVLQPGEEVRDLGDGDRAPLESQEQGHRWAFKQSYSGSGTSGRPHVLITVPKAGLTNGLTITTTKHTYYLDLKSVMKAAARSVRWTYTDEPQAVANPPRGCGLIPCSHSAITYRTTSNGPSPSRCGRCGRSWTMGRKPT